jgi:hypothetical protein
MAYENAVPIAVIVGFVSSIIILVLLLRCLKHKNRQKKAMEKDLEAAKMESSDGAWDVLTPVASPRDALYVREDRGLMDGHAAEHKMEREWRAARRAQGHA